MTTPVRSASWIRTAAAVLNLLSAVVFVLWICLPKGTPYIDTIVDLTWGWVIVSLLGLPEQFVVAMNAAQNEKPDPELESWQNGARRLKPVAEATWVVAFILWLVAPKHSPAADIFLGLATVWALLVPTLAGAEGGASHEKAEKRDCSANESA